MTGVIQMGDRELTRLRVMIDLADDRLTVDTAAMLMGLGRRQRLKGCVARTGKPASAPEPLIATPRLVDVPFRRDGSAAGSSAISTLRAG